MLDILSFTDKSIKQILTQLEKNSEVDAILPGGGILHIEKEVPYLVIYRKKSDDEGTSRFVISESSYLIIGSIDLDGYKKLLFAISDKLSVIFKSYMLFEMYTGKSDSSNFIIKGPAKKLLTSFNVLKHELDAINKTFSGIYLQTKIKDTPRRHAEDAESIMDPEAAKKCGAVSVSLEIPPIFRNDEGEIYPVFFRNFKEYVVPAVHKFMFDYIRVQTSFQVPNYTSLGRRNLKDKVFEVDRELAKIEGSYQFLWLISPSNIQQIKDKFFESNYENVIDYHYRLLPIDPDLLKRKLYKLKIEDIDDPAMSQLFREKREELDQQISMLNERGTRNFFYNSIRLYKGVDNTLCEEAKELLQKVDETESVNDDDLIDSAGFSSMARKEFDYFRQQDENFTSKVHIRKDVNIMMVSKGELYLPQDYLMRRKEALALIQHEVGTHVLTYHNGSRQPLQQLRIGLADYDPLQEGLAVMSEYLVDGLTANRLRTLAGRVIAGDALLDGGDFKEIFILLKKEYGFSAQRSFNITSRIMQGGGFLKDIIYLQGLVKLREYLKNGGEYEPLLAGKFGIKHVPIIKELTERGVLNKGVLRPSYLLTENTTEKLNLIRKGLPLSQMIST